MNVGVDKDVEEFLHEQVRTGATPSAAALVNEVLRALRIQRERPFAISPEVEEWLLAAASSPTTPLTADDFAALRERARTDSAAQ